MKNSENSELTKYFSRNFANKLILIKYLNFDIETILTQICFNNTLIRLSEKIALVKKFNFISLFFKPIFTRIYP